MNEWSPFIALAVLAIGLFAWLRTDIRDLSGRLAHVEQEIAFIKGLLTPRPTAEQVENREAGFSPGT